MTAETIVEPAGEPSTFLTTGEVCKRLSISRQTLAVWSRAGRIPFIELPSGRRRYFREHVADDYLSGQFLQNRLPTPEPRTDQLPSALAIVDFPA